MTSSFPRQSTYAAVAGTTTHAPYAPPPHHRFRGGGKSRNHHHQAWGAHPPNRFFYPLPPSPVVIPPPTPVVATPVPPTPPIQEMMMSMFTMMEERRMEEQRMEHRQMEERYRQMEERRLAQDRELKERELAIKEIELTIKEKKNAILQERVDFQKTVYMECKYGHQTYHKEKNRLLDNTNNRPCLMMSTETIQDGELRIYGTKADPWIKTEDVVKYVDKLTQKTDSKTSELEPVREAIRDYISAVSFPAIVSHNLYKEKTIPTMPKENYLSLSAWEDCAVVMEKTTECPPDLVGRYLVYLNRHTPYSPFHGIQEYKFPKQRLFDRIPSLFTKKEVEGEEKVEEYKALVEMTEEQDDDDDEDDSIKTKAEKTKKDTHKEEIGVYDDSVLSKAKIRKCLESLRCRLQEFKTQTPALSTRVKSALLGFIALNRARLEVIRVRLEKNGVYNPDATERYLQDQNYKTENQRIPQKHRKAYLEWRWEQGMLNHCDMCGVYINIKEERERGHVVPALRQNGISMLGTDGIHNLILTCRKCNQEAGGLDPYLCRTYDVVDRMEKTMMEYEKEGEKKEGWKRVGSKTSHREGKHSSQRRRS